MSKPEFVYVILIEAPKAKVWEALTKGEHTRHFWGGRAVQSDWRQGARVEFRMDTDNSLQHSGEVLEIDAPKKLVMTFYVDSMEAPEPPTKVTYLLDDFHGATKLTVMHEGFPEGSKVLAKISGGWPTILSNMKTYLEQGAPMAMSKAWRAASNA
ncbi:MAG: SRPBCC family protein [Hyphomonadaceae bacterium]|nr:SRPBCC family protein [Hyphomonadaceae bacterium]